MLVAQDLLFGPTFRKYPSLRVALSEGGIGWIPFYLDRVDRHFRNQRWIHNDFGGKLPSEVFREHILACFITDPSGLKARHQIGVDILAWECDYPHTDTTWPNSPEVLWDEMTDAGVTDEEIHKITWENCGPLLQLGSLCPSDQGPDDGWGPPGLATTWTPPACTGRVASSQRGCWYRGRLISGSTPPP